MSNIYKIIEKCKQVGVRNSFVFGLLYTTRVSLPILDRVQSFSQLFTHSFEKKRMAQGNQVPLWLKNSKKPFTLKVDWKTKWTKIVPQ